MMYFKDCSTKWSAIKREKHPHLNRVGVWESIYIEDYNSYLSISAASHLFKKEISVLAEYYVTIKHKIPTDSTMTISQVKEAVLFISTSTDAVRSLLQRLKTECNPTLYNEFTLKLEEIIAVTSTQATKHALERFELDEDIKETIRVCIDQIKKRRIDLGTVPLIWR
jgi:prephenate dehydratase